MRRWMDDTETVVGHMSKSGRHMDNIRNVGMHPNVTRPFLCCFCPCKNREGSPNISAEDLPISVQKSCNKMAASTMQSRYMQAIKQLDYSCT